MIILTLSSEQAQPWADALRQEGWSVRAWPLIETQPTGTPMPEAARTAAWIALASPRSAPHAARAYAAAAGAKPRIAALGAATARAARREDLPVHVVAKESTGAALAAEIARFPAAPASVLLPQAVDALPDLPEGLNARGFTPLAWPCYRTVPQAPEPFPTAARALVVTSPSNADALARLGPPSVPLLAFGETTARAMRERGLPLAGVLARPTPSGLLEVLP